MSSYRRRLLLANQLEENLVLYGNSVQDGTPTPEAPIDIMSIENPTIKVNGKNLIPFPYESRSQTKNGVTFTINDDGTINVNGTATANTTFVLKQNILLKKGIKYTISGCPSGGSTSTYVLYIQDMGYHLGKADTGKGSTFTAEYEKYYMGITINNGAIVDNLVFKPMLEEGATPSEYEPYEEELITIDENTPLGKNLIPYPPHSRSSVYVDNEDGTYRVNGTLKAGSCYNTYFIKTNLGDYLEHGKYYTMSLDGLNIPDGFKSIGLYIKCRNKETSAVAWLRQCHLTSNGFTKSTFYVDKDKYDYQELFIQINPVEADLTVSDMLVIPMLNEGKEVLPFEPYIPPITTMRGIGDYKDRICTKDGKVWFERNIKYYNPTPSISTATNKETAGLNWWKEDEKNYPLCTITNWNYVYTTEQMSNIGAYSVDYKKTGKLHWYISKYGSHLIPPDEETWTNATDANEYFMGVTGNIPMEYQYVLATPIITEITGSLAEKILAIDKSKNITIYSENGVYGSTEVIEE